MSTARNIYFLSIILFYTAAKAQVVAPENIILNKPKYSFSKSLPIYEVCQEMQFNFITEWQKIKDLSRAIKVLAYAENAEQNTQAVSDLVQQVSFHTTHIKHLAKPEWNSEILIMNVDWNLLRHHLFREDEFNQAKALVNGDGVRAANKNQVRMLVKGRPYIYKQIQIEKIVYLGTANEGLKNAMTIKTNYSNGSAHLMGGGLQFRLTKAATLLEICQFMKTFDVEIEVRYQDPLYQLAGLDGIFKINLKDER